METEKVNIFVRNSQKFAKVLTLPANVKASELYHEAASAHKLSVEQIHLHFQGKLLSIKGQVALYDKAIIHLVNKSQVNCRTLSFQIAQLGERTGPIKFTTNSNTIVSQFIDGPLFESIGLKSDKLFLVYMGHRLKLGKSFIEQDVQNDSEIISVSLDYVKRQHEDQQEVDHPQKSILSIHQLQTPEQPKDIYPSPDFPISIPEEINTKDNMHLIFDSKVRHTSSIHNYDLEPAQIIQQQDVANSADVKVTSSLDNEEYIINEVINPGDEEQIAAVREAMQQAMANQVNKITNEDEGDDANQFNEQVVSSLNAGRSSLTQANEFDDLI